MTKNAKCSGFILNACLSVKQLKSKIKVFPKKISKNGKWNVAK